MSVPASTGVMDQYSCHVSVLQSPKLQLQDVADHATMQYVTSAMTNENLDLYQPVLYADMWRPLVGDLQQHDPGVRERECRETFSVMVPSLGPQSTQQFGQRPHSWRSCGRQQHSHMAYRDMEEARTEFEPSPAVVQNNGPMVAADV